MKLYISSDMEGTAGVCSWSQVDPSDAREYPIYRRYMTREVRAAIDGARDVAPADVLVNDSHWAMRNLVWDELPEDVRMISGTPKPFSMGQGADGGFDAAFFTGYHAKTGDANGTLAHTSSPEVLYNVTVNGIVCSEALLYAGLLGSYGVPVALITGDRTIVEETLRYLPWAQGVIVKEAVGYSSINTLTPTASCEAIRAGARRAVEHLADARPFVFTPPIELTIDTVTVESADFIELLPGFKRTAGRTIRFAAAGYRIAFQALLVATRLGAAALTPA